MAQQAFKHIVKKVVSASAVVAASADDCKDEMDEIAHLVFGAGTVTPKYDSSTGTLVSATTPPPGQPLQVHSNPRTNAAIINLGRRMASNPSIQQGVIETINQSGWIMYGAGSMCLPLEDWDEPGVVEDHEEIEPGAVPLSDDEDWQEDFDDGTDLKAEEPLARSYPHMSITGGAPVRSNSVPLLSAHKITTDVESPDFSPTISPTPSCTSSDESTSIETLPPSSTSSPSLTDSMREHRRQRAERARKQPSIFQSFAGWIQSFFMPIPTSSSAPTSTPATATTSEEKHGVVHHEEGHSVIDEKQVVSTTSTSSSSSTSTSTATSTSTSTSTSKTCWYNNNIVTTALGVATLIILLLATKRVSSCMFTKVVAYLRRS